MMHDTNYFCNEAKKLGVDLNEKQIQQFIQFYDMLIEKNKVMNLTAITDFDEVVEKHFLDSISLIRKYPLNQTCKILDLGTGAGFPGIPLKIAFPEIQITLVDSLNKRVLFLQEVIDALGLSGIVAVHGRAEDLGRNPNYREKFDLCVSRAVANLSSLSEYCIPFVKVGGYFISYKGGDCEEEVNQANSAFTKLGAKLSGLDSFSIGENSRSLVVIEKTHATKKAYPRKAGTPTKDPL
ncbi:16S rRNA (guanine(527)-N(7))-methyltransferase RsmG [Agathobacter ruminis]|uniref:Ribosomal RNA small subunit methyltransferase G n=1 Tax=Agathobacter ruminis TaxID=1712665 RepID=A0A2G3E5C0_9FIRM|nr:16S rRNA (guanine(527)-N(7))-methyltransferase RsmG [Agathobacter ruminis]MDC7302316.1 16S rRNA (guanine(527)-N(7))-methyltransferase RsmG [Agathobacter ruminis]PHU38401.1 16S rRNA (guanine(527)-N(7))-methyltransferase RsmG [Agathobacter ruminis]